MKVELRYFINRVVAILISENKRPWISLIEREL